MDGRLIEAGADPRSVVSVQNWALTEPASPAFVTRDTAATLDDHQRQTVFMYAGNLGLGHDLETFVKALGELGASQARLEVVGGGRGREPMQRTAAAHAPGAVRFRPPVDRERLRETLADADVYLVSQRPGTEGMIVPSKVYTSMAMGRPILFCGPARCEVASLVTAAQAGFVVETGDVAAAASAMRRLSGDAALRARLGRNARLYYHRHLGKDRSLAAITSLIEQTPAPRAAAPPPMTDLADRRRQVHRRRRQIRAALQGGARRNRPRRLHRSR
jgi:glycosyltransferase involved in cell wall biosynthesis